MVDAEYFWDVDPGMGNGVSVSMVIDDSISVSTNFSTANLTPGLHRLYLRGKNSAGRWGITQPQLTQIIPDWSSPLITGAEYFFNTDPGFGAGDSFAVSPGDTISVNEIVPISSLPAGLNRIYLRAKDESGSWSLTQNDTFTVQLNNAPQIVNLSDTAFGEDATLILNLNNFVFDDQPLSQLRWNISIAGTAISSNFEESSIPGNRQTKQKRDQKISLPQTENWQTFQGQKKLIDSLYIGYDSITQTVTFSAVENYHSSNIPIEFIVMDPLGATDSTTILLSIFSINDPPVVGDIPAIIFPEDSSYRFDLDQYVTDVDHDTTEISWTAGFPANVANRFDRQIPQLVGIGKSPGEDQTLLNRKTQPQLLIFRANYKILAKISDQENDSLTIVIDPVTHVAAITATLNFYGWDIPVIFTAVDDSGATDSVTTSISIQSLNDPPVVSPLPGAVFNEDDTLGYAIENWFPFVKDPETPDPQLSYLLLSGNDITAAPGNAVYFLSGPANWFGVDTLQLIVSDSALSDTANMIVEIYPINDPPHIVNLPDSLSFFSNDSASLAMTLYGEDIDTADSLLMWEFYPGNDSLLTSYNSTTKLLTLTAQPGFVGTTTLRCRVIDDSSTFAEDSILIRVKMPVGIDQLPGLGIPKHFELSQNYPNPFNPTTQIRYGLPKAEKVELAVFNSLGQKVKTLVSEFQEAGFHTVTWDGVNEAGQRVSSGIYFYKIKAGDFRQVRKMLLVR